MTAGDNRILEILDSTELILSPAVIAKNIDYTRNYVNKRMKKLRTAGLVERVDDGYYQITAKGRDYISGNIDAEELETALDN